MKKRILTGTFILLITAIFVATRYYTPYAFDAFVGVLAVMGVIEVTRVLERRRNFTSPIIVACFPAIMYIALMLGIHYERDILSYLLYFLIIIIALFIINFLGTYLNSTGIQKEKDKYGVFESDSKYALKKSMNSAFVMIYPAMLFVCLFVINHFFELSFVDSLNLSDDSMVILFFIVFTFAVTMLTDTFALIVGMTIKGPKLCPTISPKKTISGAIGGLVFGTLGGILVYYLFTFNTIFAEAVVLFDFALWKFAIVAFVTSIIGQVGDIVASALKRSARVKDYGTLFPGHGGVMDRVDGLIFNALSVLICMFILI